MNETPIPSTLWWPGWALQDQHGALGLDRDGENTRILLLEKTSDAGESATRPDTANKGIHPALHLLPKLMGRG